MREHLRHLIDSAGLRPQERDLWDEMVSRHDPDDPTSGPYFLLWEFGYICMLELWGPPAMPTEKLNELKNPRAPLESL
jgi:hypothetical protein